MEHIAEAIFLIALLACGMATCDNPKGRDLLDAAIDYVDRQSQPEPQPPQFPCDWYYNKPEWCETCKTAVRH